VPFATSLGLGTFDGVRLKKGVKLALVAPVALEVIVGDVPRAEVADGRVPPLGQLHGEPGGFAGKQSVRALDGLRKSESLTRGAHRRRVPHLGFDRHDV